MVIVLYEQGKEKPFGRTTTTSDDERTKGVPARGQAGRSRLGGRDTVAGGFGDVELYENLGNSDSQSLNSATTPGLEYNRIRCAFLRAKDAPGGPRNCSYSYIRNVLFAVHAGAIPPLL